MSGTFITPLSESIKTFTYNIDRLVRLNLNGSIDFTYGKAGTINGSVLRKRIGDNLYFNTGLNSVIESNTMYIDNSNKLYLAGNSITTYQGQSVNRLIRLNENATIDTTFNQGSGFNNSVWCVSPGNNNKIYMGGRFTTYNGVSANRIIRLNEDGSIDTSFNSGTGFGVANVNTGGIRQIKEAPNGKIYVFGPFISYQGNTSNGVLCLNYDGSIDTSFNSGTGFKFSDVSCGFFYNNKLYIGGGFTTYNDVSANRIISLNLDGSINTDFNIGTGFSGGAVLQIEKRIGQEQLYVYGAIGSSTYNGNTNRQIVRLNLDGSIDNTFSVGNWNQNTNKILQINNLIIAVGNIISPRISVYNDSNGSINTSFNFGTGFNAEIFNIVADSNNKIYMGGNFTTYNGF